MEPLLRPGSSSQESQVRLLPAADVKPSKNPFVRGRSAPLKHNFERLELDDVSLNPRDKRCSSAPSQALPSYAASIRRPVTWWSWHSAWSMYAFLLLGVGFATGHHFFYSSLDGKPATEPAHQLRYGTLLAFLTKACLIWAVGAALRQRIWTTLRSKSLLLQGVDSLFAVADDPLAVLDWKTTMNGKIAVSMAAIAWPGPLMVILASQALSVEPTVNIAQCPGIRTLNFSQESLGNWRQPTKFTENTVVHSLSVWNSTTVNDSMPGWFDYWTFPTPQASDLARAAASQQRIIYSPDASRRACGPQWDCRYNISFTGPGYNCASLNNRTSTNLNTARTAAPPFDESILIPRGNYSYYIHATGGEYAHAQMEAVSPGGMPVGGPPFPEDLGAFRTEPVIWVGHSTMTGSGKIPQQRTWPGWNDYFEAHMFRCDMFETRYTVEFTHFQGTQSTRILTREYIKPLINTTYLPEIDANDGTNDNITAIPKDEYVYPNQDKERYRYVAAFHSLGCSFRNLINGTVTSENVLFPDIDTRAVSSKLLDPLNYFWTGSDLMESVQSMFEDILLSMFAYPGFAAVSWAADPSRISGDDEGDETTMYECIRSRPKNRFRYEPLELGTVYGVSVILATVAVAVGTVSVIQNGGVLKNTRFSSIATLLQHCGYSLDDYKQPALREGGPSGDRAG